MPFTQLNELNAAVKNDDVELIKNFCTLPKDEAPTETDLSKAFYDSVLAGSLKVISYFCESGAVKDTAVTEALSNICQFNEIAYNKKIRTIQYLCTLSTDNRPQQSAIDESLQLAVQNKDWDFFKVLCSLSEQNAPSQKELGKILIKQLEDENEFFEQMEFIFEKSTNKPDQSTVCSALQLLCDKKVTLANSKYWNYIDYLCELKGENKPDKFTIEEIFKEAVNSKKTELVKKLCSLNSDNQPGQGVVSDKFFELVKYTNDLKSLKIIQILCQESSHNLSTKIVSEALKNALTTNFPKNLRYINSLSTLNSDIKPDQATIDLVLDSLLSQTDQWALIKTLCESKSNPPSQKVIGKVLQQAGLGSLPYDLMVSLFEDSVFKPSKEEVSDTLITICNLKTNIEDELKYWPYIQYLLNLKEENKPNQKALDTVLNKAYFLSKDDVIVELCLREGEENSPSSEALENIVDELVSGNDSLELIKILCEKSTNKPSVSDILLASLQNYSEKNIYIQYLSGIESDNKPSQDCIDKVFKKAANEGDWEFVRTLCENRANPPSQKAIENLIERAFFDIDVPLERVKYFFEESFIKPSQETVDNIFSNICYENPRTKDFFNYLCNLCGDIKPSKDAVLKAFNYSTELHNKEAVEWLLQITGENALSDEIINPKIKELAAEVKLELVQSLEKLENTLTDKEASKDPLPFDVSAQLNLEESENHSLKIKAILPSTEKNSFFVPLEDKKAISCFSQSQIAAISGLIDEIRVEKNSCYSFFFNRGRKIEKISGLEELIRIGREPEMTVADAIKKIEKDKRFPELRAGIISNRTGELLDNLLNSDERVSLICK